MPPKKKPIPTPPEPKPPVYQWSDTTSYSQDGPAKRGRKDPTHWELSAGKWPNLEPVGVKLERSSTGSGRYLLRISLSEVFNYASGETPEAAAIAGMEAARVELVARLLVLSELIDNPPRLPAKGSY